MVPTRPQKRGYAYAVLAEVAECQWTIDLLWFGYHKMLNKGGLKAINAQSQSFYSHLFPVERAEVSCRLIVNLSTLNVCQQTESQWKQYCQF